MSEQYKEHAHTATPVLPPFDFTEPLGLTVLQRLNRSVQAVRSMHTALGYTGYTDETGHLPAIPSMGATDKELASLQQQLSVEFPAEYLDFLRQWRYIEVGSGLTIHGFDYDGVYPAGSPWVSSKHIKESRCLVIGNCWNYADGDQLIVPMIAEKCEQHVLLYLHEHGPKIEQYAASFSLALWRLVHERP